MRSKADNELTGAASALDPSAALLGIGGGILPGLSGSEGTAGRGRQLQ